MCSDLEIESRFQPYRSLQQSQTVFLGRRLKRDGNSRLDQARDAGDGDFNFGSMPQA